jgi:hypothetical protein
MSGEDIRGEFALHIRRGLPPDLKALVEKYPRHLWLGHANLGAVAKFWLDRHAMFRQIGGMIHGEIAGFRSGGRDAETFGAWLAPRLQFFLMQLDEHHHVEDHHYFPLFRAAEPNLTRGFDILDRDHATLHAAIRDNVEAANAFLRGHRESGVDPRPLGEAFARSTDALIAALDRHLADEEDLIVPLILDRTEIGLGIGL